MLRLLIPFSVPSAVSVYSVISQTVDDDTLDQTPIRNIIPVVPSEQTQLQSPQPSQQLLQSQVSQQTHQSGSSPQSSPSEPMQTQQASERTLPVSAWFVVWCVGTILCMVFFATAYLSWYFKFRTSVPVHNAYVEQWLKEHRLQRPISIRQSDRTAAPLTYGVLRPVILLPNRTDWENTEQLRYILLHEYVHICRFDTVTKFITAIAVCIHWFNPLVWVMYVLFNRDLELSCDESVVRLLGIASKSDYARVLISMEARKSGLMPFYNNFSKNAIEERITSIMKTGKTSMLAILAAVVVVSGLTAVFVTSARADNQEDETDVQADGVLADSTSTDDPSIDNASIDKTSISDALPESNAEAEPLYSFRADDIKVVDLRDEFVIEDYYIKNRVVLRNRYFIDGDRVLWGCGYNEFGQLGIGKADTVETVYTEPIKIADNVVSVDCSVNNYFCIYLTADGKLYGMGSNMLGLLGQEYSTELNTDVYHYEAVPTPVLLMEDVAYARAGREAIVALDKAGGVWWWGQYFSTYRTRDYGWQSFQLYWQSTEDESNPVKMLYNHPTKILENCIYATTGDWSGAAIGQNGELYTWGLNIFGECGTKVTGDDYLRTPTKVLDNVRMVWPEKIAFGSIEEELPEFGRYDTTYHFNIFVQLQDGTMVAAGENLGDKEKTIAITGDLPYSSTHTYSDIFVPIAVEEFSEVESRKKLQQLAWGMSMEEAEEILSQGGIQHFRTAPENGDYIVVEDSRYFLDFDEDGHLDRIRLQEGGSRDLQFEMGMTMEEVRSKIDDDFILQEHDDNAVYWTREPVDGSYLGFSFNDDSLDFVFESAVRQDSIDGVTMEVTEVSDISVTVTITNNTDKEIQTGEYFYLEMQDAESGEWREQDIIIDNYGFHDVAYVIQSNSAFNQDINLEWLYGKLESGKYRIVKEITDFRGTGDYTDYTYVAEFDVD